MGFIQGTWSLENSGRAREVSTNGCGHVCAVGNIRDASRGSSERDGADVRWQLDEREARMRRRSLALPADSKLSSARGERDFAKAGDLDCFTCRPERIRHLAGEDNGLCLVPRTA